MARGKANRLGEKEREKGEKKLTLIYGIHFAGDANPAR
jgi:hypothetical protein